MTFICVCMSPALDATVTLDAWPTDGVIAKDVEEVENVGGKGVNVARWLARRGGTVACGGLLGADNAGPFERELGVYGIEDLFVRVAGATRRNEMFVTPGGSFKVNRKAFPGVAAADVRFDPAALGVRAGDVVILSGSLPPCCGADFYARAIRDLRRMGAIAVLDASGEPLRAAVRAEDEASRPHVIKPNAEECAPLVGFVPSTPDDFRRVTEALRARVPHVIVSDGASGCWFDGEFVPAPQVDVRDTTAAGDTLLAEWCFRTYAEGAPDAARWAVAAGSAACTMPGGDPPSADLVRRLYDSIRHVNDF